MTETTSKTYEAPTMEVIRLAGADIICTSSESPIADPADNDMSFSELFGSSQ